MQIIININYNINYYLINMYGPVFITTDRW